MFAVKDKYFLIIESIKNLNVREIKQYNKFIIIYRNIETENLDELKRFRKQCKLKLIKFFVANDKDLATQINADGLYISAHNKKFFLNLKRQNFKFIGSAHNIKEIKHKDNQGCERILVSKLFLVKYDKLANFMGIIRFNNLLNFSKKVIPLGGIKLSNLNSQKTINNDSFAIFSEIKKKPAKIISRLL